MYEGKLIMYACIIRETFVFTVFRRVFHSILKLELCRHACRRRDQIIPTCRYGKNMPTTALVLICIPSLVKKLLREMRFLSYGSIGTPLTTNGSAQYLDHVCVKQITNHFCVILFLVVILLSGK